MPRRKRDPLKEPTTSEATRAIRHNLNQGRYAHCPRCALTFAAAKPDPPPDSVAGSVGRGRVLARGACPECGRVPDGSASADALSKLGVAHVSSVDEESITISYPAAVDELGAEKI